MLKHRGFPGRFPGTDFQFTIRRANPRGVTPLTVRERFADRKPADRRADSAFMACLWDHFEDAPFERGNLDAGRLSWMFGRFQMLSTGRGWHELARKKGDLAESCRFWFRFSESLS